MKKIFLSAICFLAINSAVAADASSESIRALMNKIGAGEIGVQVANQMLPPLKKAIPEAPEEFWQDVMKEIQPDALIDLVIPIYQKYLSQEDIDNLSAFYDTETGKKFIRVQPAIMNESMQLGREWGREIATKIIESYKEKYEK